MSRRGENIYKRKDNRWEGRLLICNDNGKPKYHSVYAKSYSQLKTKMDILRRTGIFEKKNIELNFDYFTEQWLKTVKLKCKQSTYNKYSNICKCHIIPFLGNINMNLFCNEDINKFLDNISELAEKTQNDILCVVKMIYAFAETLGYKGNACMKTISVRVPHKQMRVLSIQEQIILSNYLTTDMDLCKLGTYIALCTGIRIGELCALKKCNISFENNFIHIGATMQRVQVEGSEQKTEVIVTEPKSFCSIRDIPITKALADFLQRLCRYMPDNAYILTGDSVRFIEPTVMRYHFSKQLKACGLENVRFHTLRHSFATRCVEMGIDIKTLSEILGHENVNITLNRYVHSSMSLKRESMERLLLSEAYSPSIQPSLV